MKLLKILEKEGFIQIHDVMLENGRENKKVKSKILPVGVWDHGKWGEAVYAGPDCSYEDIRNVIGKDRIEDAMHLEAHIRNGHDYFITEDHDFIDKRKVLETKFSVRIATPVELDRMCREQLVMSNI